MKSLQASFLCLFLLGTVLSGRGELVLANFSAANPIKVMAVGDSITDDCIVNGAWRRYLQPLLETNGVPFTFVGRQLSTPTAGFTETRHEGYCGAVIAAPGVLTSPVHGYVGTNVYLQKIVRDVLTNNTPDLVLVMMGANDLGRGRSPWQVATNDLPNLLNLIFSNAPNANVMFNKALTLQNANAGGLNYGAYATNVPIYNAALQAMVNQRRTLGQNVFLADMFSAVDYATMFTGDHLHPNAAGLTAIAKEWATRIQTITIRTNQVTATFIGGGAGLEILGYGRRPWDELAQLDYNDSGWSNGIARLGYGELATATTVNFGPDPANKFVTTYFRRSFVVPWNAVITNLSFRLARSGGAAVWHNGQEVLRANLPGGPITYPNLALSAMTGYTAQIFYPTNFAVAGLPPGTNLIAVEIHQSSVTNSTLGFDLELIGTGYLLAPPSLSMVLAGENILLSWPVSNGGSFTLYSTTNLAVAGGWTMTMGSAQTNGGQIIVTQAPDTSARFFRLQKP